MRLAPSSEEVRSRLGEDWPIPGTVDAHAHVFERGFPFAASCNFRPGLYPVEYYFAWCQALGIARSVHVSAACYGFDNSATRYALEQCRANRIPARGVAIIDPEIGFVELERLASYGFVAARLATTRIAGLGPETFDTVARRCLPHRWHVEINVEESEEWLALELRIAKFPVPVVFEHLGKMPQGVNSPGLKAVLRLLEKRADFALKLSSIERVAEPAAPVIRLLARNFADRLMWGSGLPQPGPGGAPIDDLSLIATLLESLPDAGTREQVFSANAARVYGL
jgi:predicted TIM-barrel fold metal-dependent hydrolase